jgi:hypothetical protein
MTEAGKRQSAGWSIEGFFFSIDLCMPYANTVQELSQPTVATVIRDLNLLRFLIVEPTVFISAGSHYCGFFYIDFHSQLFVFFIYSTVV